MRKLSLPQALNEAREEARVEPSRFDLAPTRSAGSDNAASIIADVQRHLLVTLRWAVVLAGLSIVAGIVMVMFGVRGESTLGIGEFEVSSTFPGVIFGAIGLAIIGLVVRRVSVTEPDKTPRE